ncbi:MAG: hypothetical protein WBE72_08010 [Terracidiphilus sp.]
MPKFGFPSFAAPVARHKAAFPPATLLAALLLPVLLLCQGCSSSLSAVAAGSGAGSGSASAGGPAPAALALSPSSATIQIWQSLQFTLSGEAEGASCTWTSSSASILPPVADEEFQGQQAGNATVAVTCGSQSAQALVTVVPQVVAGPIQITSGGTYSGDWNSDDPATPAVTIDTDDPVTIEDSVITGRGTLIRVSGVTSGANVTIDNVTGTALDPQVQGLQRGAFVSATKINSLAVTHCTMTGVSFGVTAAESTVSSIQILNNLAVNPEDRPSDGQGGLLAEEPDPGHFVILSKIVAPAGAEIAWNQVMQTMGQSSTTDVINIYRSQGSSGQPIWVHDNYMEGYSSPAAPADGFTGVGVIADGGKDAPVTAFALFQDNEMVHTAGSGVSIDNGHDVTATGNRIVSCGQSSSDAWFAATFANAASIWDSYGSGPSLFYNNTVTDTAGGLVRPNAEGNPVAADFWGSALSMTYPGNSASGNDFTNPCLSGETLNLAAEDAERAYWAAKVSAAAELIGDQHTAAQ